MLLKPTPLIEILGFDEKQIFNNCTQKGNIGINYNYFPEKLIELYETRIKELEGKLENKK